VINEKKQVITNIIVLSIICIIFFFIGYRGYRSSIRENNLKRELESVRNQYLDTRNELQAAVRIINDLAQQLEKSRGLVESITATGTDIAESINTTKQHTDAIGKNVAEFEETIRAGNDAIARIRSILGLADGGNGEAGPGEQPP
jgi:chromosome segregation ATPase